MRVIIKFEMREIKSSGEVVAQILFAIFYFNEIGRKWVLKGRKIKKICLNDDIKQVL